MTTVDGWPVEKVTFLFTDVEKSTQHLQQTRAMVAVLLQHLHLLSVIIEAQGGRVFKTVGDQVCAVFEDALDALAAALEAQRALKREMPDLRVRMALHTGTPEYVNQDVFGRDYFGLDLSRAGRLVMAGHGGQVLLSQSTVEQIRDRPSYQADLQSLGKHVLRDLAEWEEIYQLQTPDLPSQFPPLRTMNVAFRRGLMRALSISTVVLAVMAGLLFNSIVQKHKANEATLQMTSLLALDQVKRGVEKLEKENGLGLLDVVQARRTAEPIPELREGIANVWAGWHQAYGGRLVNAVGHDREVRDVRFSPDGKLLATASDDGTAQLWDTQKWQPVGSPLQHGSAVLKVLFSPDGKLLATVSETRVRLWDAATGKLRGKPLEHGSWVHSIAFSPDGKLLASGGTDGTVKFWDTETGRPRGRSLQPDGNSVPRDLRSVLVGFGPPPEKPLVTITAKSVCLWNPATGALLGQLLRRERPAAVAPALAFSRDGALRAIASVRTVWLWDAAERRFRSDLIRDPGIVAYLALSPDGSLLATGEPDELAVQLWETSTGKRRGAPLWHPDSVAGVVFGPIGSRLLVTRTGEAPGGGGIVRFWDTSTGKPRPDSPPTPGGITTLALGPDGRTLAVAVANGTVDLWAVNLELPARQLPLASDQQGTVSFVDDRVLATYFADGLRLWSANTGQLLSRPASVPGQSGGAVFSQDGQILATWRKGPWVWTWQTRSGRQHGHPLRLSHPVQHVALSIHGAVLATLSSYDTVELWDAASKRPRGTPLRHSSTVVLMEFSPDESLLATAGGDRVYLWETATGRLRVPPLQVAGTPQWISFSPDGGLLAVAIQEGGAVRLWRTKTGQPYPHRLECPVRVDRCAGAFSPDGQRLAIVTAGNAVQIWDVARGLPTGPPMLHPAMLLAIRFSPDGKRLVTASLRGARVWDVATCQSITRPLLPTEPVWEARLGLKGSMLALRAGRPKWRVYRCRLPAAPVGLPAMEHLTAVALGVRFLPGGNSKSLPWKEWRQLRDRSQSFGPWNRSATLNERRQLQQARSPGASGAQGLARRPAPP